MIKVGDIVSCNCGCGSVPVKVIEIIPKIPHNETIALFGDGNQALFYTKNLVIENLTRLERIIYGFHTEEK